MDSDSDFDIVDKRESKPRFDNTQRNQGETRGDRNRINDPTTTLSSIPDVISQQLAEKEFSHFLS
jgi:hypothetical protein